MSKFSIEEKSKIIAYVSQDSFLFNGTIYENLTFGLSNIEEKDVYEIVKKVQLLEEVLKLPNGFNYHVGSNVKKLSGGQIKRLLIARALLQNPAILIMDESTSEVDVQNEQLIYSILSSQFPNVTKIVVSHKPLNQKFIEYRLLNGTLRWDS